MGETQRWPAIRMRLTASAAVGAALVLATPGTANATDPSVVALVSCVMPVQDGQWTAVFGYDNTTSVTRRAQVGTSDNRFDPDRFDGSQVDTFSPGTHQGAFSVRVPSSYASIEWRLFESRVIARRDGSNACPRTTEMPADGNGTGTAVAFGAAGVAAALYRFRRRSARLAEVSASAEAV
ncbi:hypothetical protein ACI79C_14905 [Geodermatophilus sp. SYSU D00697]